MRLAGWFGRRGSVAAYPLLGMATGLLCHLLFLLFSFLQYGGVEYMGVKDDDVAGIVASKFEETIILLFLKLAGMQLLAGMVVGLLVAAWWGLYAGWRRRTYSRGALLWRFAASVAAVHLFVLWHAMTLYPQAFQEAFYYSNWFLKAIQVVASDFLPLWLYKLLLSISILSYFVMGYLWASRLPESRGISLKRVRLAFGATGPLLVAMVMVVWGGVPDSWRYDIPEPGKKPNVILLVADSLRPDYMEQSQGGGFSSLLGESVVFEDTWSVFPRTFPSWVSMLTGQSPAKHGIRHMFPQPEKLSKHYRSVADVLRDEGYESAIFSDFAGDIFGRVDLGFDHVDVPTFSLRSNVRLGVVKMQVHLLPYLFALGTASEIPELQAYERTADPRWLTRRFLTWLDSRESEKPFLAVIFFSTTHFPYAAPYPWYRAVLSEEYDGPHKYCKVGLGLSSYTSADEVRVRSIFAGTVRAVDDEVARLKALLQRNGFWDSTIVVVTADHGETLYENGRGNGHGDTLDGSESLKVPLLFRVPGVESARVSGHASNMDLAPTLLGFLGVAVPEWMEGVNLAAEEGHKPPADRAIFSETGLLFVNPDVSLEGRSIRYGNLAAMFDYTQETSDIFLQGRVESDALVAKHHMILKGDKKLIYVPSRSKATLQCFDLSKDPDETNPLDPRADAACEALIEPLYDHMLGSGGRRIGDFVVP